MNWVNDIEQMHTKFGVNEVVREFDGDKIRAFLEFRIRFLQEELDELQLALDRLDGGQIGNVEAGDDIVDALVDLCVVSIGTMDALDVNSDLAWARVHEKNMQKQVGIKASRPNPLGLPDLIKPEGWEPPIHADNIGLLHKL